MMEDWLGPSGLCAQCPGGTFDLTQFKVILGPEIGMHSIYGAFDHVRLNGNLRLTYICYLWKST